MKNKYICIHGHFYQPPRENPWLNKVEIQDSAYPYHDWNHRINAECYARNGTSRILNGQGKVMDIMNNYSWISFNVGPTLLGWMETEAPKTYKAILEADKESQEIFSGHGAALAQSYNHLIMPLANQRDQETQVIWGIEDFRSRFGRDPEGMWLSETAVNTGTLEILAKYGIKFTILSPYQAEKTRKIGEEKWKDATGAKIDPRKPYRCNLPSGGSISIFFYDGPASQAVAFEGLLDNGEKFAQRLMGQFSAGEETELTHIATDGESYGHHHYLGEMALSYCLDSLSKRKDVQLTIYGEFLEKFPPDHEVKILENTSWSCYHGVERWKSDCGCNTGGRPEWNQTWRGPLREAFDWVREKLIGLYEKEMAIFTASPWKLRNQYIRVLLDRSENNIEGFLKENIPQELDDQEKVRVLKLLEMQYHSMLMYTSCGWFFDEVTGIETMQDVSYAARAIQLAEEIKGENNFEPHFIKLLENVPSNMPEFDNAANAYHRFVKPMALDMVRIGAHYAVSSLFIDFPEEVELYNFSAFTPEKFFYEGGKQKLSIGRTRLKSIVTLEEVEISYAILHLGEHNVFGGVREYISDTAFEELNENISRNFNKGNIYEIFNLMDHYFGNHNYSFWHLFRDEQRHIMDLVLQNNLRITDTMINQLYENNYPLLQTFKELNMAVPKQLRLPVELAINTKLTTIFKEEDISLKELKKLFRAAHHINMELDVVTLKFLVDERLTSNLLKLKKDPGNLEMLMYNLNLLKIINESSISPEFWEAQNIAYSIREEHYQEYSRRSETGDKEAEKWLTDFQDLYESINLEP